MVSKVTPDTQLESGKKENVEDCVGVFTGQADRPYSLHFVGQNSVMGLQRTKRKVRKLSLALCRRGEDDGSVSH